MNHDEYVALRGLITFVLTFAFFLYIFILMLT